MLPSTSPLSISRKRTLKEVDLYSFDRLSEFLKAFYILNKKGSFGSFTIETWTERLGYQSPRLISMVMNGKRAPSRELAEKLSVFFSFHGSRRRYFDLMVWKAVKEHQGEDTSDIQADMTLLIPHQNQPKPIDALQFAYISDWYHLVIKQLASLPEFKEDPQWIVKKLKNKITLSEATKSIQLLTTLGYLVRNDQGKLKPLSSIKTNSPIPSAAIRKHHEQMLRRAIEAIEEVKMEFRTYRSLTLKFDVKHLSEAQKMLETFAAEFDARFKSESSTEIYQLGFQLFPHTVLTI